MKPIIVGIDGSQAAIAAALWGVDEALGRGVPLRLVSVIKQTHPSPDDYARDLAHAETSLREAQFAVEASRKLVKIETEIPRGPAGPLLVEASRDAEMICVGSVGIGRYARSLLGSTATELAEKAHCPVAILRTTSDQPPRRHQLDRGADDRRTRQRRSSSNTLRGRRSCAGRRCSSLEAGPRNSPSMPTARSNVGYRIGGSVIPRCASTRLRPSTLSPASCEPIDERVQLAVISGAESDQLAQLVGPAGHPLFHHPECSVLVVRG